jgi:hypothetical protein
LRPYRQAVHPPGDLGAVGRRRRAGEALAEPAGGALERGNDGNRA